MKRKLKVLLSILGLSTIAFASVGCSAGDDIKKGMDQLFCKHEYSEFIETKAPTCEEDGEQERTCSKCDKVDVEKITALGHEYSEYTETKAPSCYEKGSKERACGICEYVDVQEIEMTKHSPDVLFGGKEPTCTEVGYFPGVKCSNENCGAIINEPQEIPMLEHDTYDIPAKEMTCFEDGYTAGIGCHSCGNVISGHELIQAPDKHTWEYLPYVAPTCESTGTETGYTCVECGISVGLEVIPTLEHNFEDGICMGCGSDEELATQILAGYTTQDVVDIYDSLSLCSSIFRVEYDKTITISGIEFWSFGSMLSFDIKVVDGKVVDSDKFDTKYFYDNDYCYMQFILLEEPNEYLGYGPFSLIGDSLEQVFLLEN